MTTEQIRQAHQAAPFRPFTIRMADGRTFYIRHPDYLFILPGGGRTIIVANDDGSASILDVLLVTELQITAETHQP